MKTVASGIMAELKCKCLVTGGSGFLGRHLVSQLLASGQYDVSVFDLRPMTDRDEAVSMIVGDLTKPHDVNMACKGNSTSPFPLFSSHYILLFCAK